MISLKGCSKNYGIRSIQKKVLTFWWQNLYE